MTFTAFLEALFNGVSLSSILLLTALGLSITFGVMRVINMAHGEMLMLGAYTAYVVTDSRYLGLNLFVAIPASFVVVALFGYLLEACLIRFLYGRPLDTLLATWGVSLIMQQTVRLSFGPDLHSLPVPEVLDWRLQAGDVLIDGFRLFIILIAGLCLLAVYLWFYWTSFGLQVRAVTQNRAMAAALGISTRRVDSLTFAFGTGLAGVAGCIFAHMYTSKPDMGTEYIVEAFMVVILGGIGNLWGAIAAAFVMGSSNSLVAKLLGGNEVMAKVIVLVVVIGFVLYRPAGLFVTKERAYD